MQEKLIQILQDDPLYQTKLETRVTTTTNAAGFGKMIAGAFFAFLLIIFLLRIPVFARWLPLLVLLAALYALYWFITRNRVLTRKKQQILTEDAEGIFYSLKTGQFQVDRRSDREGMDLILADSTTLPLTLRSLAKIDDLRDDQYQVEKHLHLEDKQDFARPLLAE
jgi:MFS superfamily sulfate permease-like transporter